MAAGRTAGESAEGLVERFLGSLSGRTQQAYTTDLEDFARFRARTPAQAVEELLASREQARRLVLGFAVDLRRRGRAWSTMRRRLGTLSSLVGMAGEVGVVQWRLEIPSEEEVTAAVRVGPGRAGDVAYFLPRHPAEIDRLDVQHYALREGLGVNYVAPLERPAWILDVGTGTGQWAYEMCEEFSDAVVVGFDLAASKPGAPRGYRSVRGNVLQGLPFQDGRFDFVHQRALISGVPVRSWASVCRDLVRVTRTGGWVELVECPPWFESPGPTTARLCGVLQQLVRGQGLDSAGVVTGALGEHLRGAGLVDVEQRQIDLAVGEWGGRIGSLMATDCRALFLRLAAPMEATFGVPERECLEMIAAMQREWEEYHTSYRFVIAAGRKPG